jgi:hypothetical protein
LKKAAHYTDGKNFENIRRWQDGASKRTVPDKAFWRLKPLA